jgi:hypothetical protein
MNPHTTLEKRGLHAVINSPTIPYQIERDGSISSEEWASLHCSVVTSYPNYDPTTFSLLEEEDEGHASYSYESTIVSAWLEAMYISDDINDNWAAYCSFISKKIEDVDYFNKTVGRSLLSYSNNNQCCDPHVIACAIAGSPIGWEPMFEKVGSTSDYYRRNRTSVFIVDYVSKNCKELFTNYMDENIFSKVQGHDSRAYFYPFFIRGGFLNEKYARKMRSEPSSAASITALRALFKSKDLYSNFGDLVVKFTDSKHEDVLCYLANNLPVSMLSFLFGTDSYQVKRTMERRIAAASGGNDNE